MESASGKKSSYTPTRETASKGSSKTPFVCIVIPTIREDSIKRFFKEWLEEFSGYKNLKILLVEDNPTKTFSVNAGALDIEHFSWEDIDRQLGESSWIIPRRSDCIRSFGYIKAYEQGVDIMITLDDDCYPIGGNNLIENFVRNMSTHRCNLYFNTMSGRVIDYHHLYPRGYPYSGRFKEVVLCHGLWNNVPDFDGETQLKYPDVKIKCVGTEAQTIPKGICYPMCGMNVAVKREVIPAFYFPLMGQDTGGRPWGMHRFGDIWAGLFSKKIIDHLDKAVVSGSPIIHHDRASDPNKNFDLERKAREANEILFDLIPTISLKGKTYKDCYKEIARALPQTSDYFKNLSKAMNLWADLF